ncbi:hypothetical protein EG329_006630 [Mollisiaceae sp. DMI_Dod_QoI]|nr:hypothetical protein EG329_006630 [Helotiales sp. DMI_Dod_QoI]
MDPLEMNLFDELTEENIEFGVALRTEDPSRDPAQDPFQFRMPNNKAIQRTNITGFDRREPMVVYGMRDATTHGTDSDGMPCTLIVFNWYLHSRARGKRFKSVRITINFATTRSRDGTAASSTTTTNPKARNPYFDPAVRAIAPAGTYSVLRVPVRTDTKTTAEANVAGGYMGVSGGIKVAYELTRTIETTDSIVVNGMPLFDAHGGGGGDPDRLSGVEWHLFEDSTHQTGLPTYFRTALLLERRAGDKENFTAAFHIKTEIGAVDDVLASVRELFGIIPRDEPVIFSPAHKDAKKDRFDGVSGKLETVSLEDECKIVMYKETAAPQGTALVEGKEGKEENEESGVGKKEEFGAQETAEAE